MKDENSIKWLKDGKEVAHEMVANNSHKSRFRVDSVDYKLAIAQVTTDDDGVYDCAMYNERREFVIKAERRYKLAVRGGG